MLSARRKGSRRASSRRCSLAIISQASKLIACHSTRRWRRKMKRKKRVASSGSALLVGRRVLRELETPLRGRRLSRASCLLKFMSAASRKRLKMFCVWSALLLLLSSEANGEHRDHLQQIGGRRSGQVRHHRHEHQLNRHHHQQRRQLWLEPTHYSSGLVAKLESEQPPSPQQQQENNNNQALNRGHMNPDKQRLRLARRETVDEAIRELRILESEDEELRIFAEINSNQRHELANGNGGQRPARDFHCHLKLMTNEQRKSADSNSNSSGGDYDEQIEQRRRRSNSDDNFCLRHGELAAQIPPFMLNLYRQLEYEQRERTPHLNFSETVQMMPYKAEIMRSFRQPKLAMTSGDYDDELLLGRALDRATIWLPGGQDERDQVDGSGGESQPMGHFGASGRRRRTMADGGTTTRRRRRLARERAQMEDERQDKRPRRRSAWRKEANEHHQRADRILIGAGGGQSGRIGNVVVELSVLNGSDDKRWHDVETRPSFELRPTAAVSELPQQQPSPACDLRRRLLPADQREEICFWFKLDDELANVIKSDSVPEGGGDSAREHLVEAELHVFKLFPQIQSVRSDELLGRRPRANSAGWPLEASERVQHATTTEQQFAMANRTKATTSNLYHLRTNLLEVSLYQILPRKLIGLGVDGELQQRQLGDFPLRLLDIRRIDLNSNGWETFYVKRAVEDWLRDRRSNLGFVIKAKSMFDEPIRVGLIRFADAYDQVERAPSSLEPMERARKRRSPRRPELSPLQARSNFSLGHQPLLVLYTTRNR